MQGEVCQACPDAVKNWFLSILAMLFGASLIGAQTWITLRGAGVSLVLALLFRVHSGPTMLCGHGPCAGREQDRTDDDQDSADIDECIDFYNTTYVAY